MTFFHTHIQARSVFYLLHPYHRAQFDDYTGKVWQRIVSQKCARQDHSDRRNMDSSQRAPQNSGERRRPALLHLLIISATIMTTDYLHLNRGGLIRQFTHIVLLSSASCSSEYDIVFATMSSSLFHSSNPISPTSRSTLKRKYGNFLSTSIAQEVR